MLEEFLDNKVAFYKGSESDDSDNDDENYNANNEQQQLSDGFTNSYRRVTRGGGGISHLRNPNANLKISLFVRIHIKIIP